MSYLFSNRKATQAVAVLLRLDSKCSLNRMKLLKLLYIADRESIGETGMPITGDTYVAMKHGPVLSNIYNLIALRDVNSEYWDDYIENVELDVVLLEDPGQDELCQYEIDKLNEVFRRYEKKSQWELRDLTHKFEEWKRNDPGHSSQPIPFEHIVDAVGRADDMDDLVQRRAESKHFSHLFGSE